MFRKTRIFLPLLLVNFSFLDVSCAYAQLPFAFPVEQPDTIMRDALKLPYSKDVLAEFAASVEKSADPACLREKQLDTAKIAAAGHELLMRYGVRILNLAVENVDQNVYRKSLKEIGGANVEEEITKLSADPVVKKMIESERPARLMSAFDVTVENLERYALLRRLRLANFSGISTGNEQLLLKGEKAQDDALQFRESNQTPEVKRFTELSDYIAEALNRSFRREKAILLGPSQYFQDADKDLAAICVTPR